MTITNHFRQHFNPSILGKRALQGAGIALVLVTLFMTFLAVFSEGELNLRIELIVPLLTVTFAGACGGVYFYLVDFLRKNGGWKKALANISSTLVYIVGLYMSLVIGLALIGLWD